MKKLVIDRQKWLHGEGPDLSYLLRNRDGKMCCVGFYCLAVGLTPGKIMYRKWPNADEFDLPVEMQWLNDLKASSLADKEGEIDPDFLSLAFLNDVPQYIAKEREKNIAAIFAKNGVEVIFEN